jgi:hypothetical protein
VTAHTPAHRFGEPPHAACFIQQHLKGMFVGLLDHRSLLQYRFGSRFSVIFGFGVISAIIIAGVIPYRVMVEHPEKAAVIHAFDVGFNPKVNENGVGRHFPYGRNLGQVKFEAFNDTAERIFAVVLRDFAQTSQYAGNIRPQRAVVSETTGLVREISFGEGIGFISQFIINNR